MKTSYHPPAPSLQTWTTIFLCTNPPSLPMMLSKSSKLIRPSESLSAYWKVLLTRIKDVGIAMQCLACSRINDNWMATKIILMPLSITCWQSSAAAHLSDSCPPSSAAPELVMKSKVLENYFSINLITVERSSREMRPSPSTSYIWKANLEQRNPRQEESVIEAF